MSDYLVVSFCLGMLTGALCFLFGYSSGGDL